MTSELVKKKIKKGGQFSLKQSIKQVQDPENRYLLYFVTEKCKMRKQFKHSFKKLRRCFLSSDIFILFFEKDDEGYPVHLRINVISP